MGLRSRTPRCSMGLQPHRNIGRKAEGSLMTDGTIPWEVDRSNIFCADCPPKGYPTNKTRRAPCPRRAFPSPQSEAQAPSFAEGVEAAAKVAEKWCTSQP